MRGFWLLPLGVIAAIAVAACAGNGSPSQGAGTTLRVVTTTAVLADFARNVGGDSIEVASIIPSGADVHTFRLTPGDSVRISRAHLIVTNGAGLDDFLDDAIASARNDASVRIAVADGIAAPAAQQALALDADDGGNDDHDAGHHQHTDAGHEESDPHFWLDPSLAMHYVERIRDGLIAVDVSREALYRSNAAVYLSLVQELDAETARTLQAIPPERRVLVSFHDAFGHFGRRYDMEVVSLAGFEGGDVSPQDVRRVLETVRARRIPAVFAEPQFDQKVLRQAAAEAGVAIGVIRSDTLDAQAPSYLAMMRANAANIASLLGAKAP